MRFRSGDPAPLSDRELARLESLTDEEIVAAATDDPDAKPLTPEQLERMQAMRAVRLARQATGLTQAVFAKTYRFSIGRLRDLEQGRTRPDEVIQAYLTLIRREPETVKRLLG